MYINNQKQSGFTLHELMIGIAVFAILTMIGVPSYLSYVRGSELSNSSSAMFSDLYYARSEAIKRKSVITICRTADATASSPTCASGSSSDWTSGWLVFVDTADNGTYESADDDLLRVSRPPNTATVTITSSSTAGLIKYASDGSLNALYAPAIYAICDDRDQDGDLDELHGRQIDVGAIGRPELTKGSITSCDSPS